MKLEPLRNDSQGSRWLLFHDAWQTIQRLRQKNSTLPLDQSGFDTWQASHALHAHPLFIIAFALHLCEQPDDTQLQGPAIIRQLVDRELKRLEREVEKLNKARAETGDGHLQFEALTLLLALAGIAGHLDKSAIDALREVQLDDIQIPSALDIRTTSLWREGGIAALQSDLLAAQLLEQGLNAALITPGPWLLRCLTLNNGGTTLEQNLSRLGGLRFDYRFVLSDKQKKEDPLIESLVDVVGDNVAVCQQLEPALSRNNLEPHLLPLVITINKTLIRETKDEPKKAGYLNNLSVRLAESGDRAGGLVAIQRAVEIIEPFATPGTTYADRFEGMKQNLALLKKESGEN